MKKKTINIKIKIKIIDFSPLTEKLRHRFEKSTLHFSADLLNAILDLKLHLKKTSFIVSSTGDRIAYTCYTPKSQKPGACLGLLFFFFFCCCSNCSLN